MSRTQQKAPNWVTMDGRKFSLDELTSQHLANIYWYHRTDGARLHPDIELEIFKRFNSCIPTLEYMPLPVDGEIDRLRKEGMIIGDDIIFEGKKIGTISHIKQS